LTAVFPVQLDHFDQVLQNAGNWSGPDDASLVREIGFTPEALLIHGDIHDDQPFVQPMVHPNMPDWWRIRYGGDGAEFIFDDPTSATRRLHIILNFSSAGVNPRVDLLASPLPFPKGFLQDAELKLLLADPAT